MSLVIRKVKSLVVREEGATMVEYGLMVALIALIAIGGATDLGGAVNALLAQAAAAL
jgi:pilus assembly protein Flp/PilA